MNGIKKFGTMKYLIILFVVFSNPVFSAVSGTAKVKGTIVSYNKKTVILSQKGNKVKVPRKSIPSHFKIRGGNEVYALLSAEAVAKKLKKEIEEENQKSQLKQKK